MFLTAHAATGILISQVTREPISAFLISFVSHYILDYIPHGDEGIGYWFRDKPKRLIVIGFVDLFLAICYTLLFLKIAPSSEMIVVISGATGAILPDFLSELHHQLSNMAAVLHNWLKFLNKAKPLADLLKKHDQFHHKIHWLIQKNLPWRIGLTLQACLIPILFYLATISK